MKRRSRALIPFLALMAMAMAAACRAQEAPEISSLIVRYANLNGVPKSLVERVVLRESRFNPSLHTRSFWGLMQLRPATARALGYRGAPAGLLDPETNLHYGVLYLANAWRVAGGDAGKALRLYSSGYYYEAKRRGRLALIRTAMEVQPAPAPAAAAAPTPQPSGLAAIFPFMVARRK